MRILADLKGVVMISRHNDEQHHEGSTVAGKGDPSGKTDTTKGDNSHSAKRPNPDAMNAQNTIQIINIQGQRL